MKSPKPFSELFSETNASAKLAEFQQQTVKFRQIHQVLSNTIADNIAQNIIVSNYKNSILYLETPSASVATYFKTKHSLVLRQIRLELLPATITIKIKVSPKSTSVTKLAKPVEEDIAPSHERRDIPQPVAHTLTEIASNAPEDLKIKLLKLAAHKKQSSLKKDRG